MAYTLMHIQRSMLCKIGNNDDWAAFSASDSIRGGFNGANSRHHDSASHIVSGGGLAAIHIKNRFFLLVISVYIVAINLTGSSQFC